MSRKLGVCYVLEGSVRKNGDQALVTAQLIDAASGRLLWSESRDGELKDLFAVRNQITQNVVGKLAIKLQDIEKRRALKKPTDSLDAYDYVLRGRESYARNTRSANFDARRMFEQAIQLDPAYASAYAALGSTRLNAAISGWTEFRDEALRDAETMAQKAIELDADNAEAHRLLGRIYFNRVQFALANAEHDRAIALNPNDAESYDARGEILVYTGHAKEALASFDIAQRLNPAPATVSCSSDGPIISSVGTRRLSRRLPLAPEPPPMTMSSIPDSPPLTPNSARRKKRRARPMTSGEFGRSSRSRNSSSSSRATPIAR